MAGSERKARRGRESAGDMVRSLGLVLVIVVVVFFFAQPPASDAKRLRLVDAAGDLRAFAQASPGVPVPSRLPTGWRSTVTDYSAGTAAVRVGWVTPGGRYAEYAADAGPAGPFLRSITDAADQAGSVDIDGTAWTQYRKEGAISLVRRYGATTVVLGSLRDTASLDELRVLARSLAG